MFKIIKTIKWKRKNIIWLMREKARVTGHNEFIYEDILDCIYKFDDETINVIHRALLKNLILINKLEKDHSITGIDSDICPFCIIKSTSCFGCEWAKTFGRCSNYLSAYQKITSKSSVTSLLNIKRCIIKFKYF